MKLQPQTITALPELQRVEPQIEFFSGPDVPASLRVCIKDTARACFVTAQHDYLSAGWDGVLDDPASTIVLIREDDRCIAIAAALLKSEQWRLQGTPYYAETTAYLVLGMVPPDRRGEGLYRSVSMARLRAVLSPGVDLVFVRTQNPAVLDCVMKTLEELVGAGELKSCALEYTFVEKGAYGMQVSDDIPLTAERDEARIALADVDVCRGDVALCVWRVAYFDPN